MNQYDSRRILTVHELKPGDVLHSGQTAGLCVDWHVLSVLNGEARIRVSGTQGVVTGLFLRQFPTYKKDDCPNCADAKLIEVRNENVRYFRLPEPQAAPVPSKKKPQTRYTTRRYRGKGTR